jgi:molybdopterin molybdotransferase
MAQLSSDTFAFGADLMRVEQALDLVTARIPPIAETEWVGLSEADGRVVVRSVVAPINLPAFDNSAVDGYAVAHADLRPGAATWLPVMGRIAAGQTPETSAARGSAVRIFTGAPMPTGTDTVFMQEDVSLLADGTVEVPAGLKAGANRRTKGEDIGLGDEAIAKGRRLEPRDIALMAGLGLSCVEVRRMPRVAVFSTGDEICEPGAPRGAAAVYDANRYALTALLRRSGCEVTDLGILRDNRDAIEAGLKAAAEAHDLVVTSGGVSAGEEDHVRAAIAGGGSLVFWRLAIKPGRPVAMGVMNGTPVVGLPGNPVAVFVTFAHIVRPLIAAMVGAIATPIMPSTVIADFCYRKKAGRREYLRVSLERRGTETIAKKYPVDGAGIITSLTRTDGLIDLAEDRLDVERGDPVPFIDYRQLT